jgi:hypothetical protein
MACIITETARPEAPKQAGRARTKDLAAPPRWVEAVQPSFLNDGMTMKGKDLPIRASAFSLSCDKRASSAGMSPAGTECFDIFSPPPGDSDVINQIERLNSTEAKIASRLVWIAVGCFGRSTATCMVVSREGVRNLTLP